MQEKAIDQRRKEIAKEAERARSDLKRGRAKKVSAVSLMKELLTTEADTLALEKARKGATGFKKWDDFIKQDGSAIDSLAAKALKEFKAGKTTEAGFDKL